MTVGNISALVQTNVKRMLAFSSIAHAGYLVMGVLVLDSSVGAVLFYLAVYSVMNLGAFAIIAVTEREEQGVTFEDYRGFASRHPWLSRRYGSFPDFAGRIPTYSWIRRQVWTFLCCNVERVHLAGDHRSSQYSCFGLLLPPFSSNMYMLKEEKVLRPESGIFVIGLIVLLADGWYSVRDCSRILS
jgi:hypothetical protein